VGLCGNLLTLLSIPYAKAHQRFGFQRDGDTTSLYILNLALCDFLFCALGSPLFVLHVIYRGCNSPIVKHYPQIKKPCFVTCVNSALCSES
jgi:hypothetical protein